MAQGGALETAAGVERDVAEHHRHDCDRNHDFEQGETALPHASSEPQRRIRSEMHEIAARTLKFRRGATQRR
jgi:hypothetical protein